MITLLNFRQTDSLKKLFKNIPTLEKLLTLSDEEVLKADVIRIDFENDTYIERLKPLIETYVKVVDSLSVIKKIAELVRMDIIIYHLVC